VPRGEPARVSTGHAIERLAGEPAPGDDSRHP
jgi:hypothetical protein